MNKNADLLVNTIEGLQTAKIGDFVVKGIDGEIWPVKSEMFGKTYEIVEE
ncbi:MAG: hypothetical protein ACHQUC_01260 [Chlamydiales bacterium]